MPPRRGDGEKRRGGHIPRPPNAFILFRSSFVRSNQVPGRVEGNHSTLSKIVGLSAVRCPDPSLLPLQVCAGKRSRLLSARYGRTRLARRRQSTVLSIRTGAGPPRPMLSPGNVPPRTLTLPAGRTSPRPVSQSQTTIPVSPRSLISSSRESLVLISPPLSNSGRLPSNNLRPTPTLVQSPMSMPTPTPSPRTYPCALPLTRGPTPPLPPATTTGGPQHPPPSPRTVWVTNKIKTIPRSNH